MASKEKKVLTLWQAFFVYFPPTAVAGDLARMVFDSQSSYKFSPIINFIETGTRLGLDPAVSVTALFVLTTATFTLTIRDIRRTVIP